MKGDEIVETLVGRELASVVFIRDYLQLTFDGPALSIFSQPTFQVGAITLQWSKPGFRDALCEQINKPVVSATVTGEREIRIEFAGGATLVVPLRDPTGVLVETAMLETNGGHDWMVWRPADEE